MKIPPRHRIKSYLGIELLGIAAVYLVGVAINAGHGMWMLSGLWIIWTWFVWIKPSKASKWAPAIFSLWIITTVGIVWMFAK